MARRGGIDCWGPKACVPPWGPDAEMARRRGERGVTGAPDARPLTFQRPWKECAETPAMERNASEPRKATARVPPQSLARAAPSPLAGGAAPRADECSTADAKARRGERGLADGKARQGRSRGAEERSSMARDGADGDAEGCSCADGTARRCADGVAEERSHADGVARSQADSEAAVEKRSFDESARGAAEERRSVGHPDGARCSAGHPDGAVEAPDLQDGNGAASGGPEAERGLGGAEDPGDWTLCEISSVGSSWSGCSDDDGEEPPPAGDDTAGDGVPRDVQCAKSRGLDEQSDF